MLRTVWLALALIVATTSATFAANWVVDPETSRIEITYTQGSTATSARFDRFQAEVQFDPDDLGNAVINAEIDITSFNSGNSQIDGAVAGADWFRTNDFATAQFQSRNITSLGDSHYAIAGDLTIRDQTAPINLEGIIKIDGSAAEAVVEVVLDRTNYGVGQGDFESDTQVKHEVPVVITIKATAGN